MGDTWLIYRFGIWKSGGPLIRASPVIYRLMHPFNPPNLLWATEDARRMQGFIGDKPPLVRPSTDQDWRFTAGNCPVYAVEFSNGLRVRVKISSDINIPGTIAEAIGPLEDLNASWSAKWLGDDLAFEVHKAKRSLDP